MRRWAKVSKSSFSGAPADAGRIRRCGTMQVYFRQVERDPGFHFRQHELERETQRRLRAGARRAELIVTIPVVVHVVHRTRAENISDAQVQSQIVALNRDFAASNPDASVIPEAWRGLVTDTKARFRLADRDPDGKATSGITRVQTPIRSFDDDDAVKSTRLGGADAWPADAFLNLWVCTLGNGLLGYAQFPGGPADTDGVVVLNTAFGTKGNVRKPFHLGRTAVHEVGHWLNFRHIWGDTPDCSGGDSVDDTPNSAGPNFGTPAFPHVTCRNGPNGDMFMNFMDYVDDDAMLLFTSQQVARMRATLDGPRSKLAN